MVFYELTNGSFCTADLWRNAQRSRSVYLGFWLRSLFSKLLADGLEKSDHGAPLGVVLAFSPREADVAASITEPRSPEEEKTAATWPNRQAM
jgi:hypothetical protein